MKINIKKFFGGKNLFKKVSKKNSNEIINPIREWVVGLSAAVVVFCVGIGVTAFDFYTQLVSDPEVITEEKSLGYRQDEVRMYHSLYKEKEETFDSLRMNKSVPVPYVYDNADSSSQGEDESGVSTDNDADITFQ